MIDYRYFFLTLSKIWRKTHQRIRGSKNKGTIQWIKQNFRKTGSSLQDEKRDSTRVV